jgi:hypothetical protein
VQGRRRVRLKFKIVTLKNCMKMLREKSDASCFKAMIEKGKEKSQFSWGIEQSRIKSRAGGT